MLSEILSRVAVGGRRFGTGAFPAAPGLQDATFDEAGILRREATPLVDRYRSYVSAGVPQSCSALDARLHFVTEEAAR